MKIKFCIMLVALASSISVSSAQYTMRENIDGMTANNVTIPTNPEGEQPTEPVETACNGYLSTGDSFTATCKNNVLTGNSSVGDSVYGSCNGNYYNAYNYFGDSGEGVCN